ncbi:MAG TPA: hypothetical protein VJJ82_00075 [Candidatus Nanoarchaeia archaeon]|nr:hypothetical protein [Candidatus Nanoarchaeia archaeon]
MKLSEYLDGLRECTDERILERDFRMTDNWPVLLFGNPDELFLKVTNAFRNSPQENGMREPWQDILRGEVWHRGGCPVERFSYVPGTVEVQVNKCFNGMYDVYQNNKINGLDHSVWVMFHPYQEKKMKNVGPSRAMALAIVSFGDYVIREKLTARFPKGGLNINHVPD